MAAPLPPFCASVEALVANVAVAALPVVELEVVALPLNDAVIVPAEKLPDESRNTI